MLDLYKNIKNYRLTMGYTQEELGAKVGYDRSMISKIEKGLVDISRSKIEEFADALEVTPIELMGLKDDNAAEAGTVLAQINKDKDLFEHVKTLLNMDAKKKETVYKYIDFLNQ